MDDDTRFKDLTLPEDEPWMSHGFISKIAAQVSLPYRKPKGGVKEIMLRPTYWGSRRLSANSDRRSGLERKEEVSPEGISSSVVVTGSVM